MCSISVQNKSSLNEMDRQRQDALDIMCFQVLRAIIYNQIKMIDSDMSPSYLRE